jgi:hypothetical protein
MELCQHLFHLTPSKDSLLRAAAAIIPTSVDHLSRSVPTEVTGVLALPAYRPSFFCGARLVATVFLQGLLSLLAASLVVWLPPSPHLA